MKHPKPNDLELVSEILAGGKIRERALKKIYENKYIRQKVRILVERSGYNDNIEFLDVFHDTMIIFDKNIRQNKYRFECELFGYIYSISKFVLLAKIREQKRLEPYPDALLSAPKNKPLAESPEAIYLRKERNLKLEELVALLGPKTARVMEMWQLSYSMKEIAEELKLSSPNMARKLKYHGYKKLLGMVKDDALLKEWYK